MKLIKCALDDIGGTTVKMPRGAKVLSVAAQRDGVDDFDCSYVFALADPDAELVSRRFRTVTVDSECDATYAGVFVGTVLLRGGTFVVHVFDEGEA